MVTMPMMKQVHQRAGGKEQVGKDAEKVCPVFRPQEEGSRQKESHKHPLAAAGCVMASVMLACVVHGCLLEVRGKRVRRRTWRT
jgi:hypothetical protein